MDPSIRRRVPPPPPKISAGPAYPSSSHAYHPAAQQRPLFPSGASVRSTSSAGYREWDEEDRSSSRKPPAYYTGGDAGIVKAPSRVSFNLSEDVFEDRSRAGREQVEDFRKIWQEEFKETIRETLDQHDADRGGSRASRSNAPSRRDEDYEYARRYDMYDSPEAARPGRYQPSSPPLERPIRTSVPRTQNFDDDREGVYVPAWKKLSGGDREERYESEAERYPSQPSRRPVSSADSFDERFFVGSPEVRSLRGRDIAEENYQSSRREYEPETDRSAAPSFAESDFSDERFLQRRRLLEDNGMPARRSADVSLGVDPALRVFKPAANLEPAGSDQPSRWAPSRFEAETVASKQKETTEELRSHTGAGKAVDKRYAVIPAKRSGYTRGVPSQPQKAVNPSPPLPVSRQEHVKQPVYEIEKPVQAIVVPPKRADPQPNRSIPMEDGMVQVLKETNGKVTQGVFQRKVTHIEAEKAMGFAGRDIFFHMKRVKGPLVPVIGDTVSVIAERVEMLPFDWNALSIEVISPHAKHPDPDLTIPLKIPVNPSPPIGQRKPPPPPILSKPKPAKRAKSPDSPLVVFDGLNIRPLPQQILTRKIEEAKGKRRKVRSPSPKQKKRKSPSLSPPSAKKISTSPSPPKAFRRGSSRSISPVVRRRLPRSITPPRRKSRSITPPPQRRRPRSRSITPPQQRRRSISRSISPPLRRRLQRSITPPLRRRSWSRSVTPPPRSRLPRSRSNTPPPRSRLPRSRSNTPPPRSRLPRSRSITPPPRSRLPRSRSNTPPPRSRLPRSRSITPPLRGRLPRSRSVSPRLRRRRSRSRSFSPPRRNIRPRSRSISPLPRTRHSPSPVKIMRDRVRSRSRSPQRTIHRLGSPSSTARRRHSRSPIPTSARHRSRSLSPVKTKGSSPPLKKSSETKNSTVQPKKKLQAKVAPVVKKDPPKIIVGKRVRPKPKVQEPAYKLKPPEEPKPKVQLGLAPEVMKEAQERVTRAKKELEAAMQQKGNTAQANTLPNTHYPYGSNPPLGPAFYSTGFYGPAQPIYGPGMPQYGPPQPNPGFFGGRPMYRHPGIPMNNQPTHIMRSTLGPAKTSSEPGMVANPLHKPSPNNTTVKTTKTSASNEQDKKETGKGDDKSAKKTEKIAEKPKETPAVASKDKKKPVDEAKKAEPSSKKKEVEKPRVEKESPKPEAAKKSLSENQTATKSILKESKPAKAESNPEKDLKQKSAELLADDNFMSENDFMDPEEALKLGCDPDYTSKAQKWMACLRCAQDGHLISMCDKEKTKRALPFDIAKAKNRMLAKKKEILSGRNVQLPPNSTKAQIKSAAVEPKRSVSFKPCTKQPNGAKSKLKKCSTKTQVAEASVKKPKAKPSKDKGSSSTATTNQRPHLSTKRRLVAQVNLKRRSSCPKAPSSHPVRRKPVSLGSLAVEERTRPLSPAFVNERPRSPSPFRFSMATNDPLTEVQVKKLEIQSLELREMEIEQEMRLLQAMSAQNVMF